MPIKYYLQPNPITPDPNDQSARVQPITALSQEDIITAMSRRGTGVTETDMRAVLNLFFDVVTDQVADGNNVNLPLVNIRPSITGIFTSVTDSFDQSRHTKRATLSAGLLLTQKMQRASVEKVLQSLPAPVLLEFLDVNSGLANSKLTPGGIGTIVGEELKFNPANEAEGIFFVDNNGKAARVSVIATRTEGKLLFSVPTDLKAGNYNLEVRRAYKAVNTLRNGALPDLLQVA